MALFFKSFAADFIKTKRTPYRLAHVVIPLCTAAVFLAYYYITPWDTRIKTEAYFQTVGVALPALIGIFCAQSAAQEAAAASFQTMLSAERRLPLFYSKLFFLAASGAFSVALASILFGVGNIFILKQSPCGFRYYLLAGLIFVYCCIILYVFHWFLALRHNKGISILSGIFESLTAALLLTALGKKVWCYIPFSWPSGLASYMLENSSNGLCFDKNCKIAFSLCAVLTICAIFLYGYWVQCWEGQHSDD